MKMLESGPRIPALPRRHAVLFRGKDSRGQAVAVVGGHDARVGKENQNPSAHVFFSLSLASMARAI